MRFVVSIVLVLTPLFGFARNSSDFPLLPMNLGLQSPGLEYVSIPGTKPKRNFIAAHDLFREIPEDRKLYIVFSNVHTMVFFAGRWVEGLGGIGYNIRSEFTPGYSLVGDFAVMIDDLTAEQSDKLYRMLAAEKVCRDVTCTHLINRFLEDAGLDLGVRSIYTSSGLAKHLVKQKLEGRNLKFISLNGRDPAYHIKRLRWQETQRLGLGYGILIGATAVTAATSCMQHLTN